MTEEEIQALQDAKAAAETKAAEAEEAKRIAEESVGKAKSDLDGVVQELTDERKKKAEALEKLNKINNPNPGNNETPDIASVIEAEFSKREQERIKTEMEQAVEEFRNSKTEFQADTSGLVFDKFKKELTKFNFSDISSKEQTKQRLEEAYSFYNQSKVEGGDVPDYSGTPPSSNVPNEVNKDVSIETKKVIEANGVSKETYNKLSSKYGDALSSLGFGS